MRAALLMVIGLALSLDTGYSRDTDVQPPVEELGTAVYFVPKQHADPDMGNHGHGFVAFVLQRTDENNVKPTFIAHSATAFVSRYRRLPRKLQQYGIWLTLQENNPYSPEEKAMLEELKSLCRKRKWPLLIHTGREDRGWQRFSSNSPKSSSQVRADGVKSKSNGSAATAGFPDAAAGEDAETGTDDGREEVNP